MIKVFQDIVTICVDFCVMVASLTVVAALATGKMPQNIDEVRIGLGTAGDKTVGAFYSSSKLFVDHIKNIVRNN